MKIDKSINFGIKIRGHIGSWGVIDSSTYNGQEVFLLEHDSYGDEAPSLIVNSNGNIIKDDVWNGFDDLEDLEEI